MLSLKVKTRENKENLEILKNEGMIPAVFYGMGKPTISISVPLVEFKKVWQKAGESTTVKISTDKGEIDTLIHEVQTHPVTDEPIHVDFLAIDMNKKIKVGIPLEFTGISNAVKNGLGTLVKVLHEVEIEALPKDLPHNLEVDISKLENIDSQILVSDIKIPTGVTLVTLDTEVVASIAVQKEEEEVVEPVDLTKIEVEKKGKKEEEGTGTEEAEKAEQ